MKKKNAKKASLATLRREALEVERGAAAAGRVVELTRHRDGSYSRREIDPEADRSEAARSFAVRSPVAGLRHRLDLSQEAFASRLGIPVSTLQKWERNATRPSGAAAALLRILDRRPELIEDLAEV